MPREVTEMFNEKRKLQFMKDSGLAPEKDVWVTNVFNLLGPNEEKLGKDLALFTAEETGRALATAGVITSVTISTRIPLVVRYKDWCAEQGFDTVQVRSSEIKVDFSDNIRDVMVATPSHLASLLAESFADKYEKSAKVIYRAYLWFGFAGMEKMEAVNLRVSDVNLKQRMAHSNRDRWYTIHELAVPDVRRACELQEFERNVRFGVATFQRAEGDLVLRGRMMKKEIPLEKYVRETLRPTVQTGFKNAGHPGLSFDRIRKSGLFYAMLQREVLGIPPNFFTIAHDEFDAVHLEPVAPAAKQKTITRIVRMYNRDYAAWKKAFSQELKEDFGIEQIPDLLDR